LRGMEAAPHSLIAGQLTKSYMAAGQFDEALGVINRYEEDEQRQYRGRLDLAAARGDAAAARALRDEFIDQFGVEEIPIGVWAMLGDLERANQMAAVWDARPLGILTLLISTGACSCGAPFDLDVTPNFARFIDEAELAWPPPRPIEWPLKDW